MKKTIAKEITIVQKESPVLRLVSSDVNITEIKSAKIQKILLAMKDALASQADGVAIAAPQIGVSLRIFVVSKKVRLLIKGLEKITNEDLKGLKDEIYINPKLTKLSKKTADLDEGCLSVRYLYGKVSRSEKATVTAYNENGQRFTRGASGLLAQIFQHEIDHLDGTLFIDKATDLVEVLPEEIKQNNV